MKKFIISVFFILGISTGYGQVVAFGIGPSSLSGGSSWKSKLGGQLSIEPKWHSCGTNGITGGLGLSMLGASYESDYGEGNQYKGKYNLTYLIVPLLYQYYFSSNFYGEIGLQPMFLLSAKDKFTMGNETRTESIKQYLQSFNLGLPGGVGYRTASGFGAGVRATYGLLNIYKNSGDDKSRTLLIALLLSYQINSLNLFQHNKK
ncbi:MAG: porin family protein [Ferruginibacter sp.]